MKMMRLLDDWYDKVCVPLWLLSLSTVCESSIKMNVVLGRDFKAIFTLDNKWPNDER